MTATATICAKYKNVDGIHVFYSDDMPGLYVAHKDAKTAFDDVGPSIQALLKLDEGVDVEVKAAQDFREFLHILRKDKDAANGSQLVMSDKRYFIGAAAA
jgi:hypothetical protein